MKTKLLTAGNSLVEAMENMKNRNLAIVPSKDNCLYVVYADSLKESDEKDVLEKYLFDGSSGGTIVFSTDVNSVQLSDNAFKNKFLQLFSTWKNRISKNKILDKIRRKNNVYAWTVGKYLSGVYTGDDGKTYDENSLSIDVIGVSKEDLKNICQDLCELFKQESVMLKYHPTNQIYFVRN